MHIYDVPYSIPNLHCSLLVLQVFTPWSFYIHGTQMWYLHFLFAYTLVSFCSFIRSFIISSLAFPSNWSFLVSSWWLWTLIWLLISCRFFLTCFPLPRLMQKLSSFPPTSHVFEILVYALSFLLVPFTHNNSCLY